MIEEMTSRQLRSTPRLRVLPIAMLLLLSIGRMDSAHSAQDHAEVHPTILVARIEDYSISPVTARYIQRAIREADVDRVACLVIVLDTPGGLVSATRDIVKSILGSRTCVVIYVAPTGAQAASAGGFITLSGHVAAMAPTTTIGAMHPVSIGSLPISPKPTPAPSEDESKGDDATDERPNQRRSPLEEKIVNNTAAWARGLAEHHGRNADWAERAVNESIVATETEAVEAGVVDLVADDVDHLLSQIDGREIALPQGKVTLHTAGGSVRVVEMWWGERLLATLADPNVAFLLMVFGFYGILFELYSPGWGVAGTLGIVCLVLAFFGLAVLPINYTGLLLIGAAFGMFVAEVFVTSYGALAIGGIVCLVMGALMLVDSPTGFAKVSLSIVMPVAAATAVISLFLVGSIVRAHRKKIQTGAEGLIGTAAVAVEAFSEQQGQYAGTVRVHGELWNAVSTQPVSAEQVVQILDRDGLTFSVEPASSGTSGDAAGESPVPESGT